MDRAAAFSLAFLLGSLIATPVASAAAEATITDVRILDPDGDELAFIPRVDLVRIEATINNTGDATLSQSLAVHFEIKSADGTYSRNDTVRRTVSVAAGNSTTITFDWRPEGRIKGNHTLTVSIEGASSSNVSKSFDVTETAVMAGSFGDRVLRHYWFFGALVLATVLFFVVLSSRKP